MKSILLLGMIVLSLGISGGRVADAGVYVAGTVSSPNAVINVSSFHNDLSPYGRWIDDSPYGSCWAPYNVSNDWRPYWDGYWSYTDYGWTWVSYEPFGWATYHYGRWVFDDYYGWVWIPDTVWGPAWVAWHDNDDWCGWAPLPPSAGWSVSFGLQWSNYSIPTRSWCFVERNHFCDTNVRYVCAPITRNRYFYDRTQDVTRYSIRNGKPINRGFDVAEVERWTGKPVRREHIADFRSPGSHDQESTRTGVANLYRRENVDKIALPNGSRQSGRSFSSERQQQGQQLQDRQARQFNAQRQFNEQRQLNDQRQRLFNEQRQGQVDRQRQIETRRQQRVDPRGRQVMRDDQERPLEQRSTGRKAVQQRSRKNGDDSQDTKEERNNTQGGKGHGQGRS